MSEVKVEAKTPLMLAIEQLQLKADSAHATGVRLAYKATIKQLTALLPAEREFAKLNFEAGENNIVVEGSSDICFDTFYSQFEK